MQDSLTVRLQSPLTLSEASCFAGMEATRAFEEHGGFHSVHEAYGVLMEEVEEFFDEVKKKNKARSKVAMRAELLQIAAVAIKAAACIK